MIEIVKLANKFKITVIDLFKQIEQELYNITIEVQSTIEKYLEFSEGKNITSEIKKLIKRA